MKAGYKVVCIKSHSQGLVTKGRVYSVTEVFVCSCGTTAYRLNNYEPPLSFFASCVCNCKKRYRGWLVNSTLFRPVDYPKLSYAEIATVEIKEGTDIPAKVKEMELCN